MESPKKTSADNGSLVGNVSENSKLSSLPDEIILRIFKNLEIDDVLRCGQVSKRFRTISRDESFGRKSIWAIRWYQ